VVRAQHTREGSVSRCAAGFTPPERAVFVLRELFDVPYEEIAEAVAKTNATVRLGTTSITLARRERPDRTSSRCATLTRWLGWTSRPSSPG
jgi:DNA-directed RNA polymerase specialized sigma24 family protein